MTATASWVDVHSRPAKDKSYLATELGTTVSDYLARREAAGLAARTLDSYERDLARLCHLTDPKPAGQIATRDLEAVISTWPLASRTRARASFRAFFDHLYADGVIPADPARRLPTYRHQRQRIIDIFTEAEQENLRYQPRLLRDRVLTSLLLASGIRKSEATALRVCDVDLVNARITIRKGKGNKGRIVSLRGRDKDVMGELSTLFLEDGLDYHDHLWYTRYVNEYGETIKRNRRLGPGGFHRWWERMCEEAGIRYRNPHTTRHTYATRMLDRGIGMRTVSKLLGHASVRTTIDLYDHQNVTDIEDELERVFDDEETKAKG